MAALLGGGSIAVAQQPQTGSGTNELSFLAADTDGDTLIDEAELGADRPSASASWTPPATAISRQASWTHQRQHVAEVDSDGDSKLSFVEVMNAKMKDFTAADTDGDGRCRPGSNGLRKQEVSTPMRHPSRSPRAQWPSPWPWPGRFRAGSETTTGARPRSAASASGRAAAPRPGRSPAAPSPQARQHPGDPGRRLARRRGRQRLVDRPNQIRGQQEQQAAATAEQQRQLDYQRQSQLQQAQVQREIEEQNLYEQWKRERGGGVTRPRSTPRPT